MLLQRGASVNLQTSGGGTALMNAANFGHTTIVQALLDAKADASQHDEKSYTALMWPISAELVEEQEAAEELAVDGDRHFVRQLFGLSRRSSNTPLKSS